MYCQNCGKELSTDVVFCPSCGAKTENSSDDAVIDSINVIQSTELNKNKNKISKNAKIMIIIFVFVVLIVIGFAVAGDNSVENADFENSKAEQTTDSDVDSVVSLTVAERLELVKQTKDINEIAEFWNVCPEENKAEILELFKSIFLTYLTENRSKIYSHDILFIEEVSNILTLIDVSTFLEEEEIFLAIKKINEIYSNADKYKKYSEANKLVRSCINVDGEIIKRIGNSASEGEYLDEYLLEYYGMYDDWARLIIYSEASLQPGRYIGYLKYKDTKEYMSDGFEYTYDVYSVMTDREIEKFFNAEEIVDDLWEDSYEVNNCFEELCEIVDNYAKKYPALITDENYIADYVGGYKDFPYEYLHKLTLKEDNTFDISINVYEGFADYTGTYKKEGNLIVCENNDIYFELVISGETLVYHNAMEYSSFYLEEGTLFIR